MRSVLFYDAGLGSNIGAIFSDDKYGGGMVDPLFSAAKELADHCLQSLNIKEGLCI